MFRPLTRKCCAGLGIPGLALACALAAVPALGGDGYFNDQLGANDDLFGFSMSELEDINADGADEFLIGAPGDNLYAGKVFFWYGGSWVMAVPPVILTGAAPEQFGRSVARIGDVNSDGREDFAVGAPMSNAGGSERGRVYVFYGGTLTSGSASTQADGIIAGENGGDRFGWSISAAGDFDGDGRDDFIVGAPLSDNTGADAGSAYVIYGATGGPSLDLADATVLNGLIAGDHFGWSVSDAGNFLAGTEDCVAVGAPGNNAQGTDAGAVYVFEGRLGGATPDAAADFTAIGGATNKANSRYGYAVRNAGRWSGDSYDDLAIGAPLCDDGGSESGRVELIFGAASPVATGDRFVRGEAASDSLGLSLARARDVLGTGAEDLLIGAPGSDQSGSRAGRAYIFRGGAASPATAAGLDPYPNVPLRPGLAADDLYGRAVSSAGDFDGDGLWDLAVAAPAGNSQTESGEAGAVSGFVHLIHSSTGPVAAEMQSWRAEWVPSGDVSGKQGQVELDFALAEPADNIARLELSRRVLDAQGRLESAATLWSGPAERGAPVAGVLTTDGRAFRFTDPGPAAPPTGGALSYAVTAVTQDGRTLALRDLAGPTGAAPTYGLAVRAFPNPSRAQVSLSFRALDGDPVEVNVFDVRGRLVRHLLSGAGTGAWMEAAWDGRDENGQAVAEGVYFLCAHSSEGTRSRRLTLVR